MEEYEADPATVQLCCKWHIPDQFFGNVRSRSGRVLGSVVWFWSGASSCQCLCFVLFPYLAALHGLIL